MDITTMEKTGLTEVLEKNERVVVKFEGKWCGPCKQLQPVLDEAMKAYEGQVFLYKADVDTHQQEAQECDVASLPTLVYFRNGSPLATTVGVVGKKEIVDNIEKYLM